MTTVTSQLRTELPRPPVYQSPLLPHRRLHQRRFRLHHLRQVMIASGPIHHSVHNAMRAVGVVHGQRLRAIRAVGVVQHRLAQALRLVGIAYHRRHSLQARMRDLGARTSTVGAEKKKMTASMGAGVVYQRRRSHQAVKTAGERREKVQGIAGAAGTMAMAMVGGRRKQQRHYHRPRRLHLLILLTSSLGAASAGRTSTLSQLRSVLAQHTLAPATAVK